MVMLFCAAVSILSLILTWVCVSEDVGRDEGNDVVLNEGCNNGASKMTKYGYNSELDLLAALEAQGEQRGELSEEQTSKRLIRALSAPSFLDCED